MKKALVVQPLKNNILRFLYFSHSLKIIAKSKFFEGELNE
tara:strand:- start:855 stop:974 length:120 start_codon:yes stop_codon:yes gene_type:complete